MVPPASARIPRVPAYSGTVPSAFGALRVRGSHPLSPPFPERSAVHLTAPVAPAPPFNPAWHRCHAVWAPPLSLAATQGISFDFLSCRYLDGSLPCVSPHARYVFTPWWQSSRLPGYPIRTPADRRSLAPPRGFSQLSASFVVWQLPGILLGPFFT